MTLGEVLKEARLKKWLTQEDVAARAGIGMTSYNQFENNKRKPSAKSLKAICRVLQISRETILEKTGD